MRTIVPCALILGVLAGVARADVVVIVSTDSPLLSLTRAELEDIYLGRENHLPNGDPVTPIDQRDTSPAYDEFCRDYLGRSIAQIKAHWSKLIFTGRGQPPRAGSDGSAVADLVAENPHAIGYVDRSLVDNRLRVVPIDRP